MRRGCRSNPPPLMRIQILSDLHLEFPGNTLPPPMGCDLGAGVGLGLLARLGLGLVEQPELPVSQLLRRGPKAPRQQQPHLQLLDARIALLDRRFVACDRGRALFEQRVALDNLRFELLHSRSQRGELFERCGAGRGGHGRESKAFPSAP